MKNTTETNLSTYYGNKSVRTIEGKRKEYYFNITLTKKQLRFVNYVINLHQKNMIENQKLVTSFNIRWADFENEFGSKTGGNHHYGKKIVKEIRGLRIEGGLIDKEVISKSWHASVYMFEKLLWDRGTIFCEVNKDALAYIVGNPTDGLGYKGITNKEIRSITSILEYELIKYIKTKIHHGKNGKVMIHEDHLKRMLNGFNLSDTYTSLSSFIQRRLNPAIQNINDYSNIEFLKTKSLTNGKPSFYDKYRSGSGKKFKLQFSINHRTLDAEDRKIIAYYKNNVLQLYKEYDASSMDQIPEEGGFDPSKIDPTKQLDNLHTPHQDQLTLDYEKIDVDIEYDNFNKNRNNTSVKKDPLDKYEDTDESWNEFVSDNREEEKEDIKDKYGFNSTRELDLKIRDTFKKTLGGDNGK